MRGITLHELKPGVQAEFSKTIFKSDVYLFAGITGDFTEFQELTHSGQ